MFHKFIKNKILAGLLLLSSLSYGGNVRPDKSEKIDNTKFDRSHQISQGDTINVNGMKFYIPPEEPSWEERKAKAVLMYWERKDPITGQIIVTKYPDTLKVKEEPHPEYYTKEDLDLLLGADRAPFYPEYKKCKTSEYRIEKANPKKISTLTNTVSVISSSASSTNSIPVIQDTSKDELDKILERLEKEEQTVVKEKLENIKPNEHSTTNFLTNTTSERTGQQDVQELLDLLDTEKTNTTNNSPHEASVVENSEFGVKSNGKSSKMAGASEVEELLNLLKNEPENSSKSNISAKASQQVTTSQITTDKALNKKKRNNTHPNTGYAIPLFLAPLAMVFLPDIKKKKDEKEKPESSNISQTEYHEYNAQNMQEAKEKRDALAERLHAIRTIEDIKNQRRILSKQMRQAKKNNDIVKIQEITDKRKALTIKRREKCLCMTNPQMTIIKEKRRLLTKKMTIARRQKDIQTMNAITNERISLRNQVKELNASIRNFDYIKNRQSFLKEGTLSLIRKHNYIGSRPV